RRRRPGAERRGAGRPGRGAPRSPDAVLMRAASVLLLAVLAALLQGDGMTPLIGVAVVYGLGQLIESFLLTPYLVGERIGLHPLAVIFALMAFGQLFGFVGVLVALPVSAALLVGLRQVSSAWFSSKLYLGEQGSSK
ncbi:MAG: AI-2E family transporter, partial [Parazoarcus communis]